LPPASSFLSANYDNRLRVESIADPYVGAAVGGGGLAGGVLRANFGITFGDMLRDRQMQTMFRVGTTKDDVAAQAGYINQQGRLNWGFVGGSFPRVSSARAARSIAPATSSRRNPEISATCTNSRVSPHATT
jgi:hypothetical protein